MAVRKASPTGVKTMACARSRSLKSRRRPSRSALASRSSCDTIVRVRLSKVRSSPSRNRPRAMLSFFDGIHAEAPSGAMRTCDK